MPYEAIGGHLKSLLTIAWLLPMLGFVAGIFAWKWQRDRLSKAAAGFSTFCIAAGFVLSTWALLTYVQETNWGERYLNEKTHHEELVAGIRAGDLTPDHDDHGGHA